MLGNKGTKKFYRTGGTRGGQNQFKWEDVKSDKDRENYLGHSCLAPIGRWQKGKDLYWYAKGKEELQKALQDERDQIRLNDEQIISEAIGLKPKSKRKLGEELDNFDLKHLLARGITERASVDIERVSGLGAAPAKVHEHIERLSSLEKEIKRLKDGDSEPVKPDISKRILNPTGVTECTEDSQQVTSIQEQGRDCREHKHKKDKKDHKRDHKSSSHSHKHSKHSHSTNAETSSRS